AVPPDRSEEGPLGRDGRGRRRAVDGREQGPRRSVVRPALESERALAHGREELVDGERTRRRLCDAEPREARRGEHQRLDLARTPLPEAGIDVAAEEHDREVRAAGQELRPPARTRRADARSVREAGDAAAIAADED